MVLRFLIDKYVTKRGKTLYTCFVDLRKAFDTVPRVKLFHKLLTEHAIGGKFLKIIQEIYRENQVYIKTAEGLLQPFCTSVGVKQGCVFSPILFNIFIDKINQIYDQNCDPVKLNNLDLNCLLWADDLVIFSETAEGLQNSINKTENFYESLGLEINVKKTKSNDIQQKGGNLKK